MSPTPPLLDAHGRPLEYLRLALTDRCNLRCTYCMPARGLAWLPRAELLRYDELLRLTRLLAGLGVRKVRLTGGEPLVRAGLLGFIEELGQVPGLTTIALTTNGVLTAPHVLALARLGVAAVNLSLDTLDRARFRALTRRDELPAVWRTFEALLDSPITLKINAVVSELNAPDLLPLAELARWHPVEVRFIEEMPFNGGSQGIPAALAWPHGRIRAHLEAHLGPLWPVAGEPAGGSAPASVYEVAGFRGRLGIIAAYSRTFCGTCNRLRLTPEGRLRTCLYEAGGLDVRALLRGGASDDELRAALAQAFYHRAADGFAAERGRPVQLGFESMATVGG